MKNHHSQSHKVHYFTCGRIATNPFVYGGGGSFTIRGGGASYTNGFAVVATLDRQIGDRS